MDRGRYAPSVLSLHRFAAAPPVHEATGGYAVRSPYPAAFNGNLSSFPACFFSHSRPAFSFFPACFFSHSRLDRESSRPATDCCSKRLMK